MKNNFFLPIFLLLLLCLCSCNNINTSTTTQNEDHAVPEVKSVFINGDSIHYIDVGKGAPVVFVHGALSDYRTWRAQMDTFAKNHRVIAYSRRFAYPNNQVINDSGYLTHISHSKDLDEFLKALNLGPAHLVGHSAGANIALLTTINHPELVRSLTLGEAGIRQQNVPGIDTIWNNFAKAFIPVVEAFKNNDNEKAARELITGVTGDSLLFSNFPQWQREIMIANTADVRGSLMYSKDTFPPLTCDDFKKIEVPVLLLNGDKSPLVLFSSTRDELYRCLSNRERATLPNSSHGLEEENPIEFNKIVLGFIDKH
jgi:pimeloyl-ACP methyl ester carboxylesterase